MKHKRPDPLKLIAERNRLLRDIRKANRAKPQELTIAQPDGSSTVVPVRPMWSPETTSAPLANFLAVRDLIKKFSIPLT